MKKISLYSIIIYFALTSLSVYSMKPGEYSQLSRTIREYIESIKRSRSMSDAESIATQTRRLVDQMTLPTERELFGNQVDAALYVIASRELNTCQTQQQQLKQDIASLQMQIQKLEQSTPQQTHTPVATAQEQQILIDQLSQKIATLTQENETLSKKLNECHAEHIQDTAYIEKEKKNVQSLQEQLKEITTLQATLNIAKTENKELEKKLKECDQSRTDSIMQLENAQKTISSLEQKLQNATAPLQEELDAAKKTMKQQEDTIANLMQEKKTQAHTITQLEKQQQESTQTLKVTEHALKETKTQLSGAENRIKVLEQHYKDVSTLQNTIDTQKNDLAFCKEKNEELSKKLNEAKQALKIEEHINPLLYITNKLTRLGGSGKAENLQQATARLKFFGNMLFEYKKRLQEALKTSSDKWGKTYYYVYEPDYENTLKPLFETLPLEELTLEEMPPQETVNVKDLDLD